MTVAATPARPPAASAASAVPSSAGRGPTATAAPPARGTFVPTVTSLAWRELTRFFRQRNRVVGAVATPILFWLLLGFGVNRAFVAPTAGADARSVDAPNYLEFFYPGAVLMMVLFTAIFATITVIEDRREGFLQGVLAAPASRVAVVLGKVLGGALIATLQGAVMLALGFAFFGQPGLLAAVPAVGVLLLIAVGLTALGLTLAWPMTSTAGFHAVMNVLLMPMWFLSGAVFPVSTAAGPVRWLMLANPLTYGQAAFAAVLQGGRAADAAVAPPVALGVTAACAAAAVFAAARVANRR